MSFSRIAENKIREAIARGDFDELPGAGQPVDLEEYFKLPPELRMAYSILKNAGCVPEEVQLMNEIAALETELSDASDDEGRRAIRGRLRDRQVQLAVCLERKRSGRA